MSGVQVPPPLPLQIVEVLAVLATDLAEMAFAFFHERFRSFAPILTDSISFIRAQIGH